MTMGIYKITHSPSGCFYIGCSVKMTWRQKTHWYALKKNEHKNQKLQNLWNVGNPEDFDFLILEQVAQRGDLIKRERFWIRALGNSRPDLILNHRDPAHVKEFTPEMRARRSEINIQRWADPEYKARVGKAISAATTGVKRGPHSDETRAKIAEKNRARAYLQVGISLSAETRAKMSATRTGKKFSEETKEKMSAAREAAWQRPEYRAAVIKGISSTKSNT